MALKKARISITNNNADRISSLPDDVICRILSFLPTADSVRTRLLSTRWKHLFSFVPVLDFYNSSGWNSPRTISFLNFVGWVFDSYNFHHMDTFHFIYCQYRSEDSRLPSWISDSVRHGVQEIKICVSHFVPQTLPRSVFTSKTLTELSLRGNFHIEAPEDACLPHLRTLSLEGSSFVDGASTRRLFLSCPLLEELSLVYCKTFVPYNLNFDISIPSLKILTIIHGRLEKFDLVLDVPNVVNFTHISRGFVEHRSYTVKGLNLLVKADISFFMRSNNGYQAFEKLARAVCHVRRLSIHGPTLKDFQRSGRSLPMFCNLTYLEIGRISCSESKLIVDILDRTPHLQVLVLSIVSCSMEVDVGSCHYSHVSPEAVPVCVSLHLMEVEFKRFSGLKNEEFEMVEYFLKNAKCLGMLKMQLVGSSKKQFETRNKLLSFPRCSRACEIVLVQDM